MTIDLLPAPRHDSPRLGVFRPPSPCPLRIIGDIDRRLADAIARWQHDMPVTTQRIHGDRVDASPHVLLIHRGGLPASEHATLDISPVRVVVEAEGAPGLFYALQTVLQIARAEGTRWRCRSIDDAPTLPLRGVSLDVSRGKVPTLDTLRRLIDRLATVKINHLQLYVEHTFDFAFDPDIARGCSPLAAADITTLDAYCRDRYIDFVPSLACFGHMGRVLSLPRYRHLAEIPPERDWESQNWPLRLHGLTLNARHPQARTLIESMLDEYLNLFSSRLANVGADETHDLGRGANLDYCRREGTGRLYIDHLKFLADCCGRHGKRMMFWGDVIRSFPDRLHELPEDAVLLDWGYEADSAFPAASHPECTTRDVCVCPGTSGWNRLINAISTADRNIANAASTARTHGAAGLIVADWGDHGHFNLLACSMPAIVQAAAQAWNPSSIDAKTLEMWLDAQLFGRLGCAAALREASAVGDTIQTWPALYRNFGDDPSLAAITERKATAMQADAQRALACLDAATPSADRDEWRIACHAVALLADKVRLHHAFAHTGRFPRRALRRFASDVEAFAESYAACWRAYNAPHRLEEVTAALLGIAQNAQVLSSATA